MNLDFEQWQAIVQHLRSVRSVAREIGHETRAQEVEGLIARIERENGVVTYTAWAQYRDAAAPRPEPGALSEWPPIIRVQLSGTQPITKATVLEVLANRTDNPASVLVTRDPSGLVGWTKLEMWP